MRVQITFRSGAQITVDVDKLQVTHDGPSKAITGIKWSDVTFGDRLLGIVPTDVVAVVELDARPPYPPHSFAIGPDGPPVEHPSHMGMTCEQYEARQG